ncbi:four helix bundle protein [Dapis sp. BLCC M229]|uniref:four helix bundle protein n=1 Tax=Dapis sp. BLCC M229 TaxID=3400188 RepID=UPI003CF30BF7
MEEGVRRQESGVRMEEGVRMKRESAKSFQDLIVWQKAHQLVLEVYRFSSNFPKTETYSLTSQLRRASVSVPGNIAEGFRKKGLADKIRFLNIAQGSLEESRYYLILANDLEYGDASELLLNLEEVSKLLDSYLAAIEQRRQSL